MPNQTVSYRIRKGLNALRKRLAKRGMVVSATALVALLSGVPVALAVPSKLLASTTAAALRVAKSAPPAVPPAPVGLKLSLLVKVLGIGLAVGVALVIGLWSTPSTKSEVSGSVLIGQEPLKHAEVVLVPDHGASQRQKAVRTMTDGEGRFRFAVGSGADPVEPGRYRVLVVDQMPVQWARKTWVVPSDYSAVLQTPLRLDVGASPVVFNIPITPVFRPLPALELERSPEWELRRKRHSLVRAARGKFDLFEW